MSTEEAIRRLKACRDDYNCPHEEACFTLIKFAVRKLMLDAIEEDYNNKDEIVYFSAPMIGY